MNHTDLSPDVSEPRPAITVLLVDDQPFVGVAIKRLLSSETDIAVHCCHAANEALAAALALRPSLILQDLVMPGIDGLTVVTWFRAHNVTAHTPVVVLSGNDDPASRERALAAGANEYLMKLPPRAELIACIRRHTVGVGTPTTRDGRSSLEAPEPSTVECRLDTRVIGDVAAGSADFASELVDIFTHDAWERLDALSMALDARDQDTLRVVAHSLKGSSSTVGARRLAAICHRLEQHAVGCDDYATARALVADVESELAALLTVFADAKLGTPGGKRGAA